MFHIASHLNTLIVLFYQNVSTFTIAQCATSLRKMEIAQSMRGYAGRPARDVKVSD